ncbi:hypothetical protein JVU11DRAFT_7477 [Chiua virens]|nr:hypothetical protein JVU11DRAFT_7477 [Chiua virens]
MADPNLEIRPDFAAVLYQPVCNAIIAANNLNDDEAIAILQNAWDMDHDTRVAAWNQQQAANQPNQQTPPPPPPPQPLPLPLPPVQQQLPQPPEEPVQLPDQQVPDKGKTKAIDFDINYALTKLSSIEYVKLWYFTPEGSAEASLLHRTQADDTFGITNNNNVLTLRSVASVKASCNARADHDLTFLQFLQGKDSLLHFAKQLGWPAKHLDSMALFFWNLENHPLHSVPQGDRVILHYAERIRHQWHDDMKYNPADAFNIAIINDPLMNSIALEISLTAQNRVTQRVSLFPILIANLS